MRDLSRRDIARLFGLGIAASGLQPALAGQGFSSKPRAPKGVLRISSNENPYGPSKAALEAAREAFSLAWRYPDEAADDLIGALSDHHHLPPRCFLLGAGSSEILKLATAAFSGPDRKAVTADPTFESVAHHAAVSGAGVVKLPLDATFAHDLEAMAKVPSAGLIYVCNPNNPTASLTPKARVREFISAAPERAALLVDEAYHDYVDSPDYESVVPFISGHPNLVVTRTFSKIFGMAGLRIGYAIAQPPMIKALSDQGAHDSVNVLAMAAARASIADAAHVAEGKARNARTRAQVFASLRKLGLSPIPSQANFFMVDMKKPVAPLIDALAAKGVQVGRAFPALPAHLRVTVGTPEQMRRFIEVLTATLS